MAKYIHEFDTGYKCEPRISILPQVFYPKFRGSCDAIDLGWVSVSMVVTLKAHSSKSSFGRFGLTNPYSSPAPLLSKMNWGQWPGLLAGERGLGAKLRKPEDLKYPLCREIGCTGQEIDNVLLD